VSSFNAKRISVNGLKVAHSSSLHCSQLLPASLLPP
jgi:hypothetical protein